MSALTIPERDPALREMWFRSPRNGRVDHAVSWSQIVLALKAVQE